MFEFLAVVLTIPWLVDHWKIILAVIVGLIILIKWSKSAKRKRQQQEAEYAEIRFKEKQKREEAARRSEQVTRAATQSRKENKTADFEYVTPVNNEKRLVNVRAFLKNPFQEYVAFDFETTGLSPSADAIIEIGAVKIRNGEEIASFSQLIHPPFPIPMSASEINNITNRMVENAPDIHTVLPKFLNFLGDAPVMVAHNVNFDASFLIEILNRKGIILNASYFDTLALAKKIWPNLSNAKLGTVAKEIQYDIPHAHRALDDARAVAAIIEAAKKKSIEIEKDNIEQKRIAQETALAQIQITDTDRRLFSDRCPLTDVQNLGNLSAGYEQGAAYYYQGELLRKAGKIEDALVLYNKARYNGYVAPALYDEYIVAYRKLQNFSAELEIIDEYISLDPIGSKKEKYEDRREKVLALIKKEAMEKEKILQEKPSMPVRVESSARKLKAVDQYTLDGEYIKTFESAGSAEMETGIHRDKIKDAARGKQKTAGGFCWKYKDETA